MLNIRDMRIDPACLGQKKLLVDVVPVYEYRDNKRTDTVVAYRYIVALPELRLEKIGVKCPKCGKDIVIRKTKKGRRYYGCEDNPECDFMSWQKPSEKKCPKCGGYMVEKGSRLVCMNAECGYNENNRENP